MAVVVAVDHETGDFSQYDSVTNPDSDLSISSGAALAGTAYGMAVLIDDATAIYGRKNTAVSGVTEITSRFYVDPNGVDLYSTTTVELLRLGRTASPWQFARVEMHDNPAYEVRLVVTDDGGSTSATSYYSFSDASHYVEMWFTKAASASSNDGVARLYIDGVLQETLSGLDLFNNFQIDYESLGAVNVGSASSSGTYYLDELVVRNDDVLPGPGMRIPAIVHHLRQQGIM